ncbi:Coenzyme F420 hydrogenase/dehydrogenase, beta subunit C-terminal domain [Frigidibacter sp. ROC022]|uniref:Coenzyme F420 hydrogenase/dehydrogenase, beta subunit C-terminal domain n=1 Tax=Frigidibacter sp. ROC022 TaxID=2971796 RepID=UPI00215A29F0|nr:Coenzyme F420 hydrogenase/dehydrogenase, beta subunit C-terminal domain [Frigidibacter sp. ROC022]MCR8726845.1 Coenzyme F420 hydrogenase/dehydrogenase, beta subunit C-terminal domain [Frigidibacter sp. ROC022]
MSYSKDGFLRPVQSGPVSPEQDRRIRQVCPGVGLQLPLDDRPQHLLWGPFLSMYSGHATDPNLRRLGSSGGVLSAVLTYLLDNGEIDQILQVAADPELKFANRTITVAECGDIAAAAGSRYAPSAPLADLEHHLASGQRFAFVGKPCDVAALQAMKVGDARIAERIPYLLSFFCAGVPSLAGAREILARMGVEEDEVTAFRYRGDGWPGMARADLRNGTHREMSYADSWGGILSRHVQFRCKICPDGIGSFADVVCADAWEADEKGYPRFEERDGVSLAVGRSVKGDVLLRRAVESGYLELSPFDPAGLSAIQPGQLSKRRFVLSRVLALKLLWKPVPAYRGFHLLRNAMSGGLRGNVRNFLGTVRRAFLGRL